MGLGEGAGKVNSLAFFLLSLVSAILPAFVLNPIAKKIGMVRTHYIAIFIMAIGYAGIFFLATSPIVYYVFISIAGIGWGSVVSLPFAFERKGGSNKWDFTIFNLSVVLPIGSKFQMGKW